MSVIIANCAGTGKAAMRTMGTNLNNYSNVYKGGTIFGTTSSNGVQLGVSYPTSVGNWSFFGTTLVVGGTGNTGVGLDYEGDGGGFFGGTVEGWSTGIAFAMKNANAGVPSQLGGFEISGSYIENNTIGVQVGAAGHTGYYGVGVAITGNLLNCNNAANTVGIQLEQASGFSVTSNRFYQCAKWAVNGLADGTNQGADNGFVGVNVFDGGQHVQLLGSNNTVTSSLSTKSANYTLSGADSWINVTGNTTITLPHAMIAQRWDVFNSGSGNVSLVCDSGTINGESTLSISSQVGKTVTTDGTNCFAH